ncbi:MAG: hypothetical protein ACI89L_000376 [Phycisphaerales bacterium]|jgi:hypothetical protein
MPRSTNSIRRRLIRRGLISLTVGLALTPGIAWGIVLVRALVGMESDAWRIRIEVLQNGVILGRSSGEHQGLTREGALPIKGDAEDLYGPFEPSTETESLLRKLVRDRINTSEEEKFTIDLISVGLPMRAMSYYKVDTYDSESPPPPPTDPFQKFVFPPIEKTQFYYALTPGFSADAPLDSRLPLRPLPLGFAINTLLYAGIVFGTWEGLGYARRARRRRKGLCAKCAHSLDGLPDSAPCPECGTLPKAAAPSANQPSA